jgi:hypothetical protein
MALRTNSRQAITNIRNYITEWSVDTLEERNEWNRQEGGKVYNLDRFENVAAAIFDIFQAEKPGTDEYYRRRRMYGADIFKDWAQGLAMGGLFCYYYNRSAVDDLGAILEETETEKSRFTESDAEDLLTNLIYREVTKAKEKADAPEVIEAKQAEQAETAGTLDRIAAAMKEGFDDIADAIKTTETTTTEPARA